MNKLCEEVSHVLWRGECSRKMINTCKDPEMGVYSASLRTTRKDQRDLE